MRSREFQEYLDEGSVPASLERFSIRDGASLYVFLHLPKCGGTTIKYYLDAIEESFYVGRLVSFKAWTYTKQEILDQLGALDRTSVRVVYGHTTFRGISAAFPKLEPRYFTAVREPVARVLSGYRYLLAQQPTSDFGRFIHDLLRGEGDPPSLAAFNDRYNWWNQMTFYLARMYAGERVPSWAKSRVDLEPMPEVTQRDFDQARRMLDACFMVLDASELEHDLSRLMQTIGAPAEFGPRPVRLNASRERYALSDADRERIAERNGWDAQLYAHATALRT